MGETAKDRESYLLLIVTRLKNLGIHKIILFGSSTSGEVHMDSDIDLIVVTNDDYLPKTYKERSDLHLKISNELTDITGEIPIDLIVYTKPMYEKFNELGSLFSKEISRRGIVLYEANH